MDKPMTQEQFVDIGGGFCPVCDDGYVRCLGEYDSDGDDLEMMHKCSKCNTFWVEIHPLTGYRIVEKV